MIGYCKIFVLWFVDISIDIFLTSYSNLRIICWWPLLKVFTDAKKKDEK